MVRIKGIASKLRRRSRKKNTSLANIDKYTMKFAKSHINDYTSLPECDLSEITDEQINSMGFTPMAKAEVMRIVHNCRQKGTKND